MDSETTRPSAVRQPSPSLKRPGDRRSLSRSATRALDVLEYFGAARRPLRAVEISRMLGLQPSTTDQLLKTMVDSAHLVFDARSKTYLPSPRLIGLSGWLIETYGAGDKLRKLVSEVQLRTGMVVTLSTPNDLFMQIIDLADPDEHLTERGMRVSMFGTSIGSAYLSTLGTGEVERLAMRARIADKDTPGILAALDAIRRGGYADAQSSEALGSLAIALPMQGLRVPVVLGLSGPTDEVRANRANLLRTMRQSIGHWIGPAASDQSSDSSSAIVPVQDNVSASG